MNVLRPSLLAALSLALAAPLYAQAADHVDVQRLSQRLQQLDADAAANAVAYERLQARQAIDALAVARGNRRAAALQGAEHRVEAAEIAVRTATLRREIDGLERERSELLVEASRQDAARARQESERLRVQAQIQAEETERLRQQADADASARQQAETALDDVAGDQTAKLKAARQREAELARREAELTGKAAKPVKSARPTKAGTRKP